MNRFVPVLLFLSICVIHDVRADTPLVGMDLVASKVGNKDNKITAKELPELVFRQALYSKYGDVDPCTYLGTDSSAYDVDTDGKLSDAESTCYLMGNRVEFIDILRGKKRTAPIAGLIDAKRFEVKFYQQVRAFAEQVRLNQFNREEPATADASEANLSSNAKFEWEKLRSGSEVSFDKTHKWSIGRQLKDTLVQRDNKISRPLIVSYKEDSETDIESLVFNGDIARTWVLDDLEDDGRLSTIQAILSGDVDTGKESFENDVSLSGKYTTYLLPKNNGWVDEWILDATPSYITDRHFRRDVYTMTLNAGLVSERLGRAGYYTPQLGSAVSNWMFTWQPKLGLTVGKVIDDGGNENLAKQKELGVYTRLTPRIDAQLWPAGWAPRWRLTGSYSHVFDLEEGFDHGLYEFSLQYDLSKLIALTVNRRKGRNLTTLDELDEWLIGIGFKH